MQTFLLIASLALQGTPPGEVTVTVDAIVTDRGGKPITGLAAAEFIVQLDGRAQPLRAVTYFAAGVPMAGALGPAFDAVTPGTPPIYRLVVAAPPGTEPGKAFAVTVAVKRTEAKVQADPSARAVGPPRATAPTPSATPVQKPPVAPKVVRIGTMLGSELFRWVLDPAGKPQAVTSPELPAGASSFLVTLELRPTDQPAPTDVLVKMALLPAGGQDPSIERIVSPELHDRVLVAEAEFPLDRVASGTYTVRAVVLSGASELGIVSTTVVKR
jgi:hypothetical protein